MSAWLNRPAAGVGASARNWRDSSVNALMWVSSGSLARASSAATAARSALVRPCASRRRPPAPNSASAWASPA
ncbi:hypothetical protein WJ972_03655 [Achromobacter insuavis]